MQLCSYRFLGRDRQRNRGLRRNRAVGGGNRNVVRSRRRGVAIVAATVVSGVASATCQHQDAQQDNHSHEDQP